MIRKIAAGLLALISLWLFWQGISAVLVIVSRGSPLADALLQPPISLWRIVATGFALAGGVLAALNIRGGAWLAVIGAVLFAAMAGAMAGMGAASRMWMDEAICSGIMLVLAGVVAFTRRS